MIYIRDWSQTTASVASLVKSEASKGDSRLILSPSLKLAIKKIKKNEKANKERSKVFQERLQKVENIWEFYAGEPDFKSELRLII